MIGICSSLVARLANVFPGSVHVRTLGLRDAADEQLWSHAKSHDMVIVSKDGDFHQLSRARGAPPKVVWLSQNYRKVKELLSGGHSACASDGRR